jgi:endonuclease-3
MTKTLINLSFRSPPLKPKRAAAAVIEVVRLYGGNAPDFDVQDPFEVLVATILSQNTNVANARAALRNLKEGMPLTPSSLSEMPLSSLESRVRVSGLHRSKARSIKAAAEHLLKNYGGGMRAMLSKDARALRDELTSIRGIGLKTADIVLAFCAGVPTVPVDTHIARISTRLGLVRRGASYESTRRALEDVIPADQRLAGHLGLINFGRTVCLARNPRCRVCPVRAMCAYYARSKSHGEVRLRGAMRSAQRS